MVRIHLSSMLALFFALFAQMLSTEGRALKSPAMKITPQEGSNEPKLRSPPSFFFTTAMAHENDFRPTAPGTSPGAGHAHTTKYEKEEASHCLNDKCTDDFRPTAPGDSPGAGHSFVNSNYSDTSGQGKRLGVAHTQAAKTDDYRPTVPGHSPGAGHPMSKEIKRTNS